MKCILIAFAAVIAVASAGILAAPGVLPVAYSAPYVAPYAAYAAGPVPVAPVVPSGYVAATRGSVHVAPLPEGPFAASRHINTLPAPGTL